MGFCWPSFSVFEVYRAFKSELSGGTKMNCWGCPTNMPLIWGETFHLPSSRWRKTYPYHGWYGTSSQSLPIQQCFQLFLPTPAGCPLGQDVRRCIQSLLHTSHIRSVSRDSLSHLLPGQTPVVQPNSNPEPTSICPALRAASQSVSCCLGFSSERETQIHSGWTDCKEHIFPSEQMGVFPYSRGDGTHSRHSSILSKASSFPTCESLLMYLLIIEKDL